MGEVTFAALLGMVARHDDLVRKRQRLGEIRVGLGSLDTDQFNDTCPALAVRISPGVTLGLDVEIRYDSSTRSALVQLLDVLDQQLEHAVETLDREIKRHGGFRAE